MSPVILTKLKLQSINYVYTIYKAPNKFMGDEIRLVNVYVCDVTQNETPETIFSRKELNYNELVLETEIESSDDESECNEI